MKVCARILRMVEYERLQARNALSGEVRFDKGMRAAYASDASNYRQVPIGVVLPHRRGHRADDARVLEPRRAGARAAARPRSTGKRSTSRSSSTAPSTWTACFLSTRKRGSRASSPAWCATRCATRPRYGLTFAPDPATHSRCTLGGMIGNNSCGPHSVMGGTTVQNIERLEVLTYDGASFWCGPTSDADFHNILSEGAKAEIYPV